MSLIGRLEALRVTNPPLISLAEAVSLAVRVEPELLRRARLDSYLVPDADGSAEADLWFSPFVDTRSTTALMFVPEVAERLRRQLAEDGERLDRAWQITRDVHAHTPALALEEEVNYLLLAEGPDSPQLQRRLQEAVVALVKGGEDRAGVARWAIRALSRLPAAVAETEAGQMLTVAARSRLGRPDVLPEGVSPDAEWLPWVLPREADHVRVGVRLFADGLEIGSPNEGQGHVIPLPNTEPLVVHVSWREGLEERRREVRLRPDRTARIRVRQAPLATLDESAGDEVLGLAVVPERRTLWRAAARAGARFAFIRATSGAGEPYDDAPFRAEWPRMRALLIRGAYHRGADGSGAAQADRLLSAVEPGPHDLLALDLATPSRDPPMAPDQAQEFAERIHERTGRWPGLRIGPAAHKVVEETNLAERGCWLWWATAKEPTPPEGWSGYAFARSAGGPLTYRFNGPLAELLALAGVEEGRGVAPTFTLQTAWGDSYTIHPQAAPVPIAISAHSDGRSSFVAWKPSGRIDGCLGFALQRRKIDGETEAIGNPLDFKGSAPSSGPRPSTGAPFQRFTWLDAGVHGGDAVQYRAVPMLGSPGALHGGAASAWSDPVTISTTMEPGLAVTFNRGVLGLAALGEKASPLGEMIESVGSQAREWLGGDLLTGLMDFLSTVANRGGSLYAALYELSDPEAVAWLSELGPSAKLLLPLNRPEGRRGAKSLAGSRVDVSAPGRRSGGLFHHRFAVACDADGSPERVWVGGANWSPRGLCVQANGAVIVTDRDVAARFLERWQLLHAGTARPSDRTPPITRVGSARVTAWFAPVSRRVDLADVEQRLQQARRGILFAMPFASRGSSFAPDVVTRHAGVYLRGVVTAGQGGRGGITLVDGARSQVIDEKTLRSGLPQKIGIGSEFLSRIVVIDPFSDHSTVLMGSHNLSPGGSAKNDETLLVVENAPAFAAAHAVRVMALYQHYEARGRRVRSPRGAAVQLRSDDRWQDRLLTETGQSELDFWLGAKRVTAPT